jgi:hypothetical protein
MPKNGTLGLGTGRTSEKSAGPVTAVSLATVCCIAYSGLTDFPPAPHQPGPVPTATSMPRRSASAMA